MLRPVETEWFALKLQGKRGDLGLLNYSVNSLACLKREGSISHCERQGSKHPTDQPTCSKYPVTAEEETRFLPLQPRDSSL